MYLLETVTQLLVLQISVGSQSITAFECLLHKISRVINL